MEVPADYSVEQLAYLAEVLPPADEVFAEYAAEIAPQIADEAESYLAQCGEIADAIAAGVDGQPEQYLESVLDGRVRAHSPAFISKVAEHVAEAAQLSDCIEMAGDLTEVYLETMDPVASAEYILKNEAEDHPAFLPTPATAILDPEIAEIHARREEAVRWAESVRTQQSEVQVAEARRLYGIHKPVPEMTTPNRKMYW
jgi:hypothetical protein